MSLATKLTFTTASVLASTLVGVSVLAIGPLNAHANVHAQAAAAHEAVASHANVASSSANTHLAAAKLRACQNREHAIDNIMARIANRGQKQLTLFGTIATRVENFYTQKGKTLANYDALVADVNAKAAAAQTTVNTVKSDSANFKCDGTDPTGAAQTFKADLKAEISALQAYRTSVKNLIVGVKSVQGTTNSTTNSTVNSTTGGQY